ncbi:MAG: ParB/RepB/Spo0J family partition protein [Candidatus Neomarinimicrobiota bacterium]|nr:ParB/RepB/Spo0J family partition protein [Candidatus Neomarinimicrobiota bacterium]
MSSKRLGRGIEALINSELNDKSKKPNSPGVSYINLSDIKPNPDQPRRDFNNNSLDELSKSIKEKGVITPITIRESNKGYEIIAGERRWRAAKKAKLKSIPAYILNIGDEAEMMEVALIENIQREDLNPIEEAEGYAVLNSKYSLSHDGIAKTIGKKRTTISNALRLLKLPPEIRKSIRSGEITAGHGRAILQKKSISAMKNLWKKIVNESLSVRSAESLVKPKAKKKKIKSVVVPSAPIKAIENQLIEIFGTKVKLKPAQIGGSIEIIYFSDDDLERIIDLLQSL